MESWWKIIQLHKVIDLLCQWWIHSTASVDTEQFLLNVNVRGEIAKKSFIRMHKNTREIWRKNSQTENSNIWNWIGKGKNSDIQWKSCYSLLCAWPFWQSFVSFFRIKNWYRSFLQGWNSGLALSDGPTTTHLPLFWVPSSFRIKIKTLFHSFWECKIVHVNCKKYFKIKVLRFVLYFVLY